MDGRRASAPPPQRPADRLHAVARGGALNLLTSGVGALLGFVLVVIVGRELGPGGAGVFFESVGLFTILASALELGAPMALVRSISASRELGELHVLPRLPAIGLGPVLALSTAAAILAFVLVDPIAAVFFSPGHREAGEDFVRVLIPFVPLAAGASVALGGTRGFGTMVPFVLVRNLGKPILRPALTVAAIVAGLGPAAIALAWVVPAAVEFPAALLALAILLRRTAGVGVAGPRRAWSSKLAGEFWRFAAPRGAASVFQISVLWLDVLLVGAIGSTREAGVYGTASRFALLGTLAIEAVRLAIAPQLGAMFARRDLASAQRVYRVATWWLMIVSWPAYIVVALFSPVVLRIFGPGFGEAQDALTILALAMLVNIGTGNVNVVLLMAGKSIWNLQNTAISFAINVTLNVLLIPRYGITGAAAAWAASIAWDNLAPLVQIRRSLGLSPFGRGYLRVVAAGAAFGAVALAVRLWLGAGWGSLGVALALALVPYVAILARGRVALESRTLRDALRSKDADEPIPAGLDPAASEPDPGSEAGP